MTTHCKTVVIALVIFSLLVGCSSLRPEGALTATKVSAKNTQVQPTDTLSPNATPTLSPPMVKLAALDEAYRPLSQAAGYIQDAQMFDERQAMKHVEYLAGDELEGRRPGTPGGQKAGDYIAARFAEYGLQPAAADGTYFQPISPSFTTNVVASSSITVSFPSLAVSSNAALTRSYAYLADYVPRIPDFLGSGDATGQVVWFGNCDPGGMDASLSGKILLCRLSPSGSYQQLVEQSLKYKIGGLLLIKTDGPTYCGLRRWYSCFHQDFFYGDPNTLPAFQIPETAFQASNTITQDLLAGSQYTLDNIDQAPVPTLLSTSVHMAVSFQPFTSRPRNVLGLLPGSDPRHKDEIVIIGPHYDGLGRDLDGIIYNGANDNASGVAVVLEIAHLWQVQGFRPARSVLFAAWDDEEAHLGGSGFYVSHPIYPLDHTVAMLGEDSVGMLGKLWITENKAVYETRQNNYAKADASLIRQAGPAIQFFASAETYGYTPFLGSYFTEAGSGDSDAYNFSIMGIPAASYITIPRAEEEHIHTAEDDARYIKLASLRAVGVASAHALAAWSGGGPTLP